MQDLSAALATRNLQDSIGSSGANQLFTLESAELVERESICGNLVCEAGERPTTTNGANGGTTPQIPQEKKRYVVGRQTGSAAWALYFPDPLDPTYVAVVRRTVPLLSLWRSHEQVGSVVAFSTYDHAHLYTGISSCVPSEPSHP